MNSPDQITNSENQEIIRTEKMHIELEITAERWHLFEEIQRKETNLKPNSSIIARESERVGTLKDEIRT